MATALREPDVSPPDAELPTQSLSLGVDGTVLTPIEGVGDPALTTKIVVRQLGILPVADGGPFAYVAPGRNYHYGETALAVILDQLCRGTFNPNDRVDRFNRPLDLNLATQTCFIFFLKSLGDPACDWRFCTDARAVMLGDFKSYDAEKDNYFYLRHVLSNGTQQEAHFEHPTQCRIVYFFVRRPTRASFNHPINFNVELYYPDDQEGKNTIPIVIDPDIRYPGGSGVDGGP